MATTWKRENGGTTYHLAHQWNGEQSIGERIVDAVAECEDIDRASLPSLDGSINPDALSGLFRTSADDDPKPGCVTFSYYGYTVVVRSTGQVLLRRE